jgi:hypothetical protein
MLPMSMLAQDDFGERARVLRNPRGEFYDALMFSIEEEVSQQQKKVNDLTCQGPEHDRDRARLALLLEIQEGRLFGRWAVQLESQEEEATAEVARRQAEADAGKSGEES